MKYMYFWQIQLRSVMPNKILVSKIINWWLSRFIQRSHTSNFDPMHVVAIQSIQKLYQFIMLSGSILLCAHTDYALRRALCGESVVRCNNTSCITSNELLYNFIIKAEWIENTQYFYVKKRPLKFCSRCRDCYVL